MGKKVLPSDEEILQKTGIPINEWFSLIEQAGLSKDKHGKIVDWLLDEKKLQLFYAHAIAHKFDETRASSD